LCDGQEATRKIKFSPDNVINQNSVGNASKCAGMNAKISLIGFWGDG
jgi:hypothetical protein